MGFYLDLSLYKLFSFLITNSHVSGHSVPRYLLIETCFSVETGHLVNSANLYCAPYSTEGFLKSLSESFINNICVKICNSSSTLQFFHITPNNLSKIFRAKKTSIYNILHFLTLYLFSLWSCFELVWQNLNQLRLNIISLLCFTQLLWKCFP